jgi:GH15 family glucan-1,4-alpha-glucosidase
MQLEDLAIVGNCQYAALIDRRGEVVWCCLPRFDAEPLFSTLLASDGGSFRVGLPSGDIGTQRYLGNTNVLETRFDGPDGSFRVVDFAPRFMLHDRSYRPTMLVRMIEPLAGTPTVRVSCDPKLGWSRAPSPRVLGSNHMEFEGFGAHVRLTTDVPLSYLDGTPFPLSGRRHLVLTWGPPVEEPLRELVERYLSATLEYWTRWVRHCRVPPRWQREVIRSALALKLHCFEDTGAIVASITTSIPEAPGSGRTWDYRYCWLRDSYYVLSALRMIGHFEERQHFMNYLLQIAQSAPDLDLAPLYRIDGRRDLDERVLHDWSGFEGHGPVRVGNGAARHQQHDVYGEMVLALAPIFHDERFEEERSPHLLDLLERLARRAIAVAGTPDAGIWEYRTEWVPQTFSSMMCWAAVDRVAAIAARHRPAIAAEMKAAAARIHDEVLTRAWSSTRKAFVGAYGGTELDASLLQMVVLRMLAPDDARLVATVEAVDRELKHDGWVYRYRIDDGFGVPAVAFTMCSFWLVEALAGLGRVEQARAMLDQALGALSPLGLLSEDIDTRTLRMWGNFPQAYSHVGLIHAAFASSPRWADVL